MAELTTMRERARTFNSLACLLKGLIGHVTTVDLRDGSSCVGRILQVDSIMNTTMSNVVFSSIHSWTGVSFEEFYIQVEPTELI